jgi:hypothetical protein
MNRASGEAPARMELVGAASSRRVADVNHQGQRDERLVVMALLPQDQWQPIFAISDYHDF